MFSLVWAEDTFYKVQKRELVINLSDLSIISKLLKVSTMLDPVELSAISYLLKEVIEERRFVS